MNYLMAGILILNACIQARSEEKKSDPVEYNKDIRPIFQETCFQCHGTDAAKAKGDLQLVSLAHATKKNPEGRQAIVPGDPDQSLLIERIFTSDKEEIMPPLKIHKNLTDAQKSKLKNWISQGARYQEHWAYLAPKHSPIPVHVQPEFWANNVIDAWIAKQLNENGLRPNDEADRYSLIRRASLDLLGLLPSPDEIDAFVKDPDPQAYEQLIDRLLASPRYGEEMARQWLDLARYGDSHGIHIDNHRSIWPYRDPTTSSPSSSSLVTCCRIRPRTSSSPPAICAAIRRRAREVRLPRNIKPYTTATASSLFPAPGSASPWVAPPATTTSSIL
jgi:mono/diheme cytochrome c family protein